MIEKNKLFVLAISILVISAIISLAITFTFTEIKESKEELLIKIDTDRAPVGIEPLTLNLSARVLNAKGKISYEWNLGNGERSNKKKVMVTYDEPGTYNCTLTVTDETGRRAMDSIKVVVEGNRPPIVTLNINKKTIERKFTWLNFLALLPVPLNPYAWAGNQQLALDRIENKKGPLAWGESEIVITAQINDPEGDEIVSYEWREQTADKLVTITGKTFLPVHNLTGNESVKIPALYAWMKGRHIVTLTVRDSAGNVATATTDYIVSESQRETTINTLKKAILFIPNVMNIVRGAGGAFWNIIPKESRENIFNHIDELYEEIKSNPTLDKFSATKSLLLMIIERIPNVIGIPYEHPFDKAEISISKIQSFNFSTYVNESGVVDRNITLARSFNMTNIDSNLAAFDIYVTLSKPFSDEKGLPPQFEKDGVIVEIKVNSLTKKLFYQKNYTEWKKGIKIDELSPGDNIECTLYISLREGLTLEKREYECHLYIYQGKTLHREELVDVVPFKVIV